MRRLLVAYLMQASCAGSSRHAYVSASAGWDYSCAVRDDHTLWCWGDLNGPLNATLFAAPQQITTDRDWTEVWSGFIRTCATKSDGSVWCWSRDEIRYGGMTYTTMMEQTPQSVLVPDGAPAFAFVPGAALQSCLLDANGGLSCWGPNVFGEVGNSTRSLVASPVAVPGGPWRSATVAGDDVWWAGAHTCALDGSGALSCWGSDNLDQLGFLSAAPVATPAVVGTSWKEIGTGTSYTCGIGSDGTISCWGHAFDPNSPDMTTTPWQVSSETDWTGLSAGASMACALRGDASAWCWGYGPLGSANAPSVSDIPLQVGTVASWSSISVGLNQGCGLDESSMLWCWGNNSSGQVGNGTFKLQPEPTPIP
jgi:alpha-tubulin suppressor-like RCC1 family protein